MQHPAQVMLAAVPGTLVHRFFLAPHRRIYIRMRRDDVRQIFFRKRVKLLDPDNSNMSQLILTLLFQQVVIHLAATKHDASDIVFTPAYIIQQHCLEFT